VSVTYHREAMAEVVETAKHYAGKDPGLALIFLSGLMSALPQSSGHRTNIVSFVAIFVSAV